MLSRKSQLWLKGRTTSGDLKISMPRSQPRNSNSVSLGRSSRHQYIWKNPQGDSSRRPRRIIKSQFSPWYCQMRGELWARVFLNPSRLFLLRTDPEIQHRDPKQEQSPPRSSLGPVFNKLRDLMANSSLGSLCCGLRLTESSFQEKWGSKRRIHLWALMPWCSGCAEDSLTSSWQKEMKTIRADQLLVLLGGSATVGWLLAALSPFPRTEV